MSNRERFLASLSENGPQCDDCLPETADFKSRQ